MRALVLQHIACEPPGAFAEVMRERGWKTVTCEIDETGDYDLEGLFIRLGHAIDSIGAKRVVLDTLETLFSGLSNVTILRAELRRLFRWLKEKGLHYGTFERAATTVNRPSAWWPAGTNFWMRSGVSLCEPRS